VTLASISYIFKVFIKRAVTFIKGVVTFIGGAIIFIEEAMTFTEGAITFISGAVIFIGKGSSATGGRLFKIAKARVNRHNLRQRLIIYKLKDPLLLINSLISTSNYSVRLFL
jgi:hypothetical protein